MSRRIVFALLVVGASMIASPAHAGGGGCAEYTTGSGTEIVASHNCFRSTVMQVEVGDTVTWTNDDAWQHNLVTPAFRGTENLTTHSVTFDQAGVYPYVCTIHWGMVGAIVVGDADVQAAAASTVTAEPATTSTPMAATIVGAGLLLGLGLWLGRGAGSRLLDRS